MKSSNAAKGQQELFTQQRRYPRVYLQNVQSAHPRLAKILGARGSWSAPKGVPSNASPVCDLSYTGIAFLLSPADTAAAEVFAGHAGQVFELTLHLAGEKSAHVAPAKLARVTSEVAAFDFLPLATEVRIALDRFLHAKLIGLSMRSISPEFFAREPQTQVMSHWFQGPQNSNIILWHETSGEMNKAVVETGGDWLQWTMGPQGGQIEERLGSPDADESDPLSRTNFLGERVRDVSYGAGLHLVNSEASAQPVTPFLARVLDLLTHVPDEEKVLQPLVRALAR
jgi:hypothetical protein